MGLLIVRMKQDLAPETEAAAVPPRGRDRYPFCLPAFF